MTKQIFLSNIIITNSEVAVKRRVQMCVFVVCVRVCNRLVTQNVRYLYLLHYFAQLIKRTHLS